MSAAVDVGCNFATKWIAFQRPEEIFLRKFVRYFRRACADPISAGVTLHMRGSRCRRILCEHGGRQLSCGNCWRYFCANFDELSAKLNQLEHDSSGHQLCLTVHACVLVGNSTKPRVQSQSQRRATHHP